MPIEREVRLFSTSLRALTRNGKKTLTGRAASFGTVSHPLGEGGRKFREIIKPGAFTGALENGDETILTFNHLRSTIMARTRNGSLRLGQSSQGLEFVADLLDTTMGNDAYKMVSSGLISECSFAFVTLKESWPTRSELAAMFSQLDMASLADGLPVRLLEDLNLFDVAIVCDPAYPSGTSVDAFDEISSVDPAATRPHMEGASIPERVLVEARKRGGASRDPELERMRRKALAFGKRIAGGW